MWDYPISDRFTKIWAAMTEASSHVGFNEAVWKVKQSQNDSREGNALVGKCPSMFIASSWLLKQQQKSPFPVNHSPGLSCVRQCPSLWFHFLYYLFSCDVSSFSCCRDIFLSYFLVKVVVIISFSSCLVFSVHDYLFFPVFFSLHVG